MATGGTVSLSPATAGTYHVAGITDSSSKKASQLLQQNHDRNHIFFNASGFHNHIAHHLLAIFALGATPEQLQRAYDGNIGYQRPQYPIKEKIVQDMSDRAQFKQFLGKEKHFHDYEDFFRREIDEKGWQAVLKEHLFAGDEHADDLLMRMYAGFYHPLIHLGYGVEFEQPAIVAEALAQAAVHDVWVAKFFKPLADQLPAAEGPPPPLVRLLEEARSDKQLVDSVRESDGNKVRDGILARAPDAMLRVARQWHVHPRTQAGVDRATAEMINASAWFAGAAQRPPKTVKFDFFYMHCVNAGIFFSTFARQDWMSVDDKIRMLEMKARLDLALYVSRGCPELKKEEIEDYREKVPGETWEGVARRVGGYEDDGHASKLVRALGNGAKACEPYEGDVGDDVLPIRGDMWRKLANMAIDSVEAGGPRWVRNAGFDSAWAEVPERERSRL